MNGGYYVGRVCVQQHGGHIGSEVINCMCARKIGVSFSGVLNDGTFGKKCTVYKNAGCNF